MEARAARWRHVHRRHPARRRGRAHDLLDRAAATVDETQRQADYREVEKVVDEDLVFCWLSRGFVSTITHNDVKGVVRYLFRDMYFATLWLDR